MRFRLPPGVTFAGTASDSVTIEGDEVIVTVGRVVNGSGQTAEIPVLLSSEIHNHELLWTTGSVSSSTALPIGTNNLLTYIVK